MAKIGSMLMNVHKGKMEMPKEPPSKLRIMASYGPDYGEPTTTGSVEMYKMDCEEHVRCKKQIDGIKKALDNWVPEDVAAQARESLENDLEDKKSRLDELASRIKRYKSKTEKESPEEDEGEVEESEED